MYILNVCLHVLPGATAAISKSNFIQWLYTVIQCLTKYDSLVYEDQIENGAFITGF